MLPFELKTQFPFVVVVVVTILIVEFFVVDVCYSS